MMENAADPAAMRTAACQGTAAGTEAHAPRARIPKNGPAGFRAVLSVNSEPTPANSGLDDHQRPRMEVVDREEDADSHAGKQKDSRLALVPEPELVRLGAAVHAGQRAENGVADQLRAPGRQERQGRHGHADRHPPSRHVVLVGRGQAVQRTDVVQQGLHNCLSVPVVPWFPRWPGVSGVRGARVLIVVRTRLRPARMRPPTGKHTEQASKGGAVSYVAWTAAAGPVGPGRLRLWPGLSRLPRALRWNRRPVRRWACPCPRGRSAGSRPASRPARGPPPGCPRWAWSPAAGAGRIP